MLEELEGVEQPGGALLDGSQAPTRKRPSLEARAKLVDLGIKVARELGTEVDPGAPIGAPPEVGGRPPRRRGKVEF